MLLRKIDRRAWRDNSQKKLAQGFLLGVLGLNEEGSVIVFHEGRWYFIFGLQKIPVCLSFLLPPPSSLLPPPSSRF
jgi:hypothetical protein